MAKKLYEGKEYFILIIDGSEYQIDEPLNWDDIKISCPRDESYGFSFDFVDGQQVLGFTWDEYGGGKLLESVYLNDGGDGVVFFEFGLIKSSNRIPQYYAQVNLNDRNPKIDAFYCGIEKTTFESKLQTRWDVKFTMTSDKDADNNTITPLEPINILLHSKEIIKTSIAEITPKVTNGGIVNPPVDNGAAIKWFQPDTLSVITEELNDFFSLEQATTLVEPDTESRYQYKAIEAGVLTARFEGDAIVYKSNGHTFKLSPFVRVKRSGIVILTDMPTSSEQFILALDPPAFTFGQYPITWDVTWSIDVLIDDEIYIGFRIERLTSYTNDPDNRFWFMNYYNKITLTQKTVADRSLCKAHRLFDVINQCIYAATGLQNKLISNYFGEGGAAEKFVLTNGFQIRIFEDKPLQISMKQIIDSLKAIFNIGTAYFNDGTDDFFMIEPMLFFYGNGIIMEIVNIIEYEESHDTSVSFNEFEIGYEEFAVDEFNSLDDFNTQATWLLPISSYKAKKSILSSIISSGYVVEIQRRDQFLKSPSKSLQNDDSPFIVAYVDDIVYKGVNFTITGTTTFRSNITFSKPIDLYPGDTFVIQGADDNNGVHFTVISKIQGSYYNYEVTPHSIADEIGIGNVIITIPNVPANTIYSEQNQNFSIIDNTLSASNAYNLRLSLKHMLYNWSPFINIGLSFKNDDKILTPTFGKNNVTLRTQFAPFEENKGLVGDRILKEDEPITLSDFNRELAPYTPNMATLKAILEWDQVLFLKKALRGELTGDDAFRNRGKVIMKDRDGKKWTYYIKSFKYDPQKKIAEIVANKVEPYWFED